MADITDAMKGWVDSGATEEEIKATLEQFCGAKPDRIVKFDTRPDGTPCTDEYVTLSLAEMLMNGATLDPKLAPHLRHMLTLDPPLKYPFKVRDEKGQPIYCNIGKAFISADITVTKKESQGKLRTAKTKKVRTNKKKKFKKNKYKK